MPTSTGRGEKKFHYNKMKITSVLHSRHNPRTSQLSTPIENPKAKILAFKEQALLSLGLGWWIWLMNLSIYKRVQGHNCPKLWQRFVVENGHQQPSTNPLPPTTHYQQQQSTTNFKPFLNKSPPWLEIYQAEHHSEFLELDHLFQTPLWR